VGFFDLQADAYIDLQADAYIDLQADAYIDLQADAYIDLQADAYIDLSTYMRVCGCAGMIEALVLAEYFCCQQNLNQLYVN